MPRKLSVCFCVSKRDWLSMKADFLLDEKIRIICSVLLSARLWASVAQLPEGRYGCSHSI